MRPKFIMHKTRNLVLVRQLSLIFLTSVVPSLSFASTLSTRNDQAANEARIRETLVTLKNIRNFRDKRQPTVFLAKKLARLDPSNSINYYKIASVKLGPVIFSKSGILLETQIGRILDRAARKGEISNRRLFKIKFKIKRIRERTLITD